MRVPLVFHFTFNRSANDAAAALMLFRNGAMTIPFCGPLAATVTKGIRNTPIAIFNIGGYTGADAALIYATSMMISDSVYQLDADLESLQRKDGIQKGIMYESTWTHDFSALPELGSDLKAAIKAKPWRQRT
jgi:hypothetical protein